MWQNIWDFVKNESNEVISWVKCGEGLVTTVPTILWAVGSGALARRLLTALFRRFIFRRVPPWELVLQNLLFTWMVVYSLHFWMVLVRIIKIAVDYCYDEADSAMQPRVMEIKSLMQQWVVWMFSTLPLVVYLQTRPRPELAPVMIWITTNPWQRREMGPYGYYLNRPPASIQATSTAENHHHALNLRRAFSDSKIIIKEPPKKRRYSKSV